MRMLKQFSFFLCFTELFLTFAAFAGPMPLDGVAAIVNDAIITKSELAQETKIAAQQIRQNSNTPPDPVALEKQVLEHLIMEEVQLQMAKRTGIQVDDPTLDNTIENIANQNGMSLSQLREALDQEGMDYRHYRNKIRHQMMVGQLHQRDIANDIHVSEQEVSQFLKSPQGMGSMTTEYRLGHILVALSEAPTPEETDAAQAKAQQIVAQLRQGEDFATLALAQSQGEQALNGGDLGWRKLPELPTIFEKIIPSLSVNDVPPPIRSSSGFHIIKLLDKRSVAQQAISVEKTLARHILIKTNAVTSDHDAKQRLTELRKKILQGEDFAQLAKTHSADLGSASNGGSLGWVSKEVLVPEFAQKMDNLGLQEISEPFQTSFGWHIVQVLEREKQTNDETNLRQKAKEMLHQRKIQEKLQAWARQLRDEAYVKTYYES